jgi:hypothetical protein
MEALSLLGNLGLVLKIAVLVKLFFLRIGLVLGKDLEMMTLGMEDAWLLMESCVKRENALSLYLECEEKRLEFFWVICFLLRCTLLMI